MTVFSLWKVTRAAFDATAKLLLVQLRGEGDEGDDNAAARADGAVVYQQAGVAAKPLTRADDGSVIRTLRALAVDLGDEVAVLKFWDKARQPTDLEDGETRVFSVGTIGNVLRLLRNRAVLEAPEVRLGATATKKVNREGDSVRNGSLVFAFNPAGPTLSITYNPPDGPPVVLASGSGTITLAGITGPGSNKVRAED